MHKEVRIRRMNVVCTQLSDAAIEFFYFPLPSIDCFQLI